MTKDRKGNVGIIVSANTGEGTPSASLSIYKSNTNAPTIYHQKGTSAQIGGSIDIGASSGLKYVVFPDSTTNDVYSRDNYFYRFWRFMHSGRNTWRDRLFVGVWI